MDYNIYIHALGYGGSGGNDDGFPTKPWFGDSNVTKPWDAESHDSSETFQEMMKGSKKLARDLVDGFKGKFANAAPAIVTAYAAVKGAQCIIDTIAKVKGYIAQNITGDYVDYTQWEEASNILNIVMHPISTFKEQMVSLRQTKLYNNKVVGQAALLGDSAIIKMVKGG